jgi:hypothetical protein
MDYSLVYPVFSMHPRELFMKYATLKRWEWDLGMRLRIMLVVK